MPQKYLMDIRIRDRCQLDVSKINRIIQYRGFGLYTKKRSQKGGDTMPIPKDVMDIRICDIDRNLVKQFQALCHDERKSVNIKLKEMIQEEVDRK